MFRSLIRSLPFDRTILTRHASPILASHAANVRIIRMRDISFDLFFSVERGINKDRDNIKVSRAKRDIRR